MNMNPSFITFTGVDDWSDINEMAALSDLYPIEWGILFSPTRQGVDPRYPRYETISRIVDAGRGAVLGGLRFAAHICGGHARAIMDEGPKAFMEATPARLPVDLSDFRRIQVNHAAPSTLQIQRFARGWSTRPRGIAQSRGSVFPSDERVDWLFDCSGGTGAEPAAWPPHPGWRRLVGYAGGINPANVASVVDAIGAAGPYWIDMESGVRTDNRVDLAKCRAVCESVYGARRA